MTCEQFIALNSGPVPPWRLTLAERVAGGKHFATCEACRVATRKMPGTIPAPDEKFEAFLSVVHTAFNNDPEAQ